MSTASSDRESFLPVYDRHIAARVGKHRSNGFRSILGAAERAMATTGKPLFIVETGGLRQLDNWQGDGQSTRIFDAFASHHGGIVFSVDLDPICSVLVRQVCSPRTIAVTGDSVTFLQALPGKDAISILYLDSMDLDLQAPEPSSQHHRQELLAVIDRLVSGTVIAVDDNPVINGQPVGKGLLVEACLAERRIPMIHDGYQKVWQLP